MLDCGNFLSGVSVPAYSKRKHDRALPVVIPNASQHRRLVTPSQRLLHWRPTPLGELREGVRASFALRMATGAGGSTR